MRKLIYFVPRGNLASTITSDMLFGALCWGMRETGALSDSALSHLLANFDPPQFAFSNLFPAYRHEQAPVLRFYPKPLSLNAQVRTGLATNAANGVSKVGSHKAFQSIGYLSEGLLKLIWEQPNQAQQLLHPSDANGASSVRKIGNALLSQNEFKAAKCENLHGWPLTSEAMAQRNQIDRLRGSAADGLLFYEPETAFAPRVMLWCLAVVETEAMWKNLQAGLRYLADTGLGANRSSGRGQFDICWEDAPDLPHASASNGVLCLSNYVPRDQEINLAAQPLAYNIQSVWPKRERRFRANTPIYKRPMRMISAGSVLPLPNPIKPIYGRLVEAVAAEGQQPIIYQSGLMVGLEGRL